MAEATGRTEQAGDAGPAGGVPRPVALALLVGGGALAAGAAWLIAVRGEAILIDLYAGARALLCF